MVLPGRPPGVDAGRPALVPRLEVGVLLVPLGVPVGELALALGQERFLGPDSIELKQFGLVYGLKSHLSLGLRFPTQHNFVKSGYFRNVLKLGTGLNSAVDLQRMQCLVNLLM